MVTKYSEFTRCNFVTLNSTHMSNPSSSMEMYLPIPKGRADSHNSSSLVTLIERESYSDVKKGLSTQNFKKTNECYKSAIGQMPAHVFYVHPVRSPH